VKKPLSAAPANADYSWNAAWLWTGLVVTCIALYWPALRGDFLWDDAGHVTRPDLQSLGGLWRIWLEIGATQQFYPVLHSAFWVEHKLWGDSTFGYHLVNVLLHATVATQLAVILRRLRVPGALLAALLFAFHPVCVESVAWISEQKNTLSAVFYLAAALAWLHFENDRRPRIYALATALFVLALLTKTVTATLPAALLVICWWRRGRLELHREVLPLVPWFAVGAAAGLFTAHFESTLIGAQGEAFSLGFVERVMLSGRIFWFYVGSLAWPFDLNFIYPRWTVDASSIVQWAFLVAALALLGVLVWWSRRQRGPLAATLLFGGTLFPVLGFFNVYPFLFSYVADHFQYLASLSVFVLAAVTLTTALERLPRVAGLAIPLLLLAGLAWITRLQSEIYRDEISLYEATLARNPTAWMVHNNLALALSREGRPQDAVSHLHAALRLRPDYAQAESNLGDVLSRTGRSNEAIPHLERAIKHQPNFANAHNNLGNALVLTDRVAEAIPCFEAALRHQPNFPLAHRNLAMALAMLDRTDEALHHFARAIELKPDFSEAEMEWAMTLALMGHFPEAEPHFRRALEIQPGSVSIRSNYGRMLAGVGRTDDAIRQFSEAIQIAPNHAELHFELAKIYRNLGRRDDAARHYTRAVQLDPALLNSP
jgi:tetratricopeptide (TPR) repeat protein